MKACRTYCCFTVPLFSIICTLVLFAQTFFAQNAFASGGSIQCGTDADADIVIMIDRTGSINSTEMAQQKTAAKALLNFFTAATLKPRVAIGTFNVVDPGADARIVTGGSLTDVYGADGSPGTGLYAAINGISSSGSGNTNVSVAIEVAQNELNTNAQSSNRYIALISDGITNRPSSPNSSSCSGGTPGAAANAAANAAESAGTKIFAIHFGDDSGCAAGTGVNFLQNQMATTPAFYYEGNADLSGVFEEISEALVCDDGDTCTQDTCNTQNQCEYTPIGDDSDGDGVADCQDKCPGADDTQLGEICGPVGIGVCENYGENICECGAEGVNGPVCQIRCDAVAGNPMEEKCNSLDDDCDALVDEDFNIGETCLEGVGACQNNGQLVCISDTETTCNAVPGTPTGEVCNRVDDDCNGVVDDIASESCSVGIGACQNSGTFICDGSDKICNAEPGVPSAEVCNGIDDDCNGLIDDGIDPFGSCTSSGSGACQTTGQYVCVQGAVQCNAVPNTPGTESCNGIDDNCNDVIDDGFDVGVVCTVGVGACENTGAKVCTTDGSGTQCSANPGTPTAEVCNGIDDDCNGIVDDIAAESCTVGTGSCESTGQYTCEGENKVCNATPGEPSTEVCDGIDNNCNEIVDDVDGLGDSCSEGVGACASEGSLQCGEGGLECSATPGEPSEEVCDDIDNDCDGTTDEVFDVCGVQCGDGSSCATPTPTPPPACEGTIDECGVCNGDGTTCKCVVDNLGSEIAQIDGSSQALLKYGTQMAKTSLKLVKAGKGKKGLSLKSAQAIVNSALAALNAYHVQSWEQANIALPQQNEVCGAAIVCVNVETVSTLDQLALNATAMLNQINQIQKKTGVSKQSKAKMLYKLSKKAHAENSAAIAAFPKVVSNCDQPVS